MGNIVPDALSLRLLSIPAQGWRRFDARGADGAAVDEGGRRWRWPMKNG